MTFIGFHYLYQQCGLEIYTQPAQNSMRGPATTPQKEISGPRPPRPASENLIQARASPRAAGARGQPAGCGGPRPARGLRGPAARAGRASPCRGLIHVHRTLCEYVFCLKKYYHKSQYLYSIIMVNKNSGGDVRFVLFLACPNIHILL